jgi:hypothetical protein
MMGTRHEAHTSRACVQSSRSSCKSPAAARLFSRGNTFSRWTLVLCVLGVHGHFDTAEIQFNCIQVENTCALSGTSARLNLSSTAANYVCVAEQPHACRATQTCVFSRGRAFSRWRWALVLCVLGVYGHFDTAEIQFNCIQVENTCALSGTSARPNLSSTAANYVCWCIDGGCARH